MFWMASPSQVTHARARIYLRTCTKSLKKNIFRFLLFHLFRSQLWSLAACQCSVWHQKRNAMSSFSFHKLGTVLECRLFYFSNTNDSLAFNEMVSENLAWLQQNANTVGLSVEAQPGCSVLLTLSTVIRNLLFHFSLYVAFVFVFDTLYSVF